MGRSVEGCRGVREGSEGKEEGWGGVRGRRRGGEE